MDLRVDDKYADEKLETLEHFLIFQLFKIYLNEQIIGKRREKEFLRPLRQLHTELKR
ncbi:MAG: hypothetical protein J6S87_02370 [Bacteroidales bacterium]|nr:hypothetical protein [Bacteroidales bacterium]